MKRKANMIAKERCNKELAYSQPVYNEESQEHPPTDVFVKILHGHIFAQIPMQQCAKMRQSHDLATGISNSYLRYRIQVEVPQINVNLM